MKNSRQPLPARCLETRDRLPAFAAKQLGPTSTGEVQAHLLSCQSCSEAFGDLLTEEVESGAVPLLTPARMPPLEWYDAYMRAGGGRFVTFWKSIEEAKKAADTGLHQWAQRRRNEIAGALDALTRGEPAPARVRSGMLAGAVRTRGAVVAKPQPPAVLTATVISDQREPTADEIHFTIDEPAHVTGDGHFTLGLSTDDAAHDDRVVICTLALPGGVTVSFAGAITRHRSTQREKCGSTKPDSQGLSAASRPNTYRWRFSSRNGSSNRTL